MRCDKDSQEGLGKDKVGSVLTCGRSHGTLDCEVETPPQPGLFISGLSPRDHMSSSKQTGEFIFHSFLLAYQ
jgi:hypothetical protein